MAWLTVTIMSGLAVSASAAGPTPFTKVANPNRSYSVSTNNFAASLATAAASAAPAITAGVQGAEAMELAALAADIAVSGFPVNIWRETITRHIPEQNTWEVTIGLHTDFEADIDYEPEGWEAKIKSSKYYQTQMAKGTPQSNTPSLPQTVASLPTTLISQTKASATSSADPGARVHQETSAGVSVTRHPAPEPQTYSIQDFEALPRPTRSQTRVTLVDQYAQITADVATPTSYSRDYLWNPIHYTVSSQNQEVYFGVHDDAGQDIIKASVGVEPKPVLSIHGATRQLSLGGEAVTFKGHTFTMEAAGLKVGSTTLSMQAIAPAFPTDFQAVLTIDEAPVTFIKDANNPTIMHAGAATVTLNGPALMTKGHEIVYNTDGALILDHTISIDPSPIRISGRPVYQPSPVPIASAQNGPPGKAPGQAARPVRGPLASAIGQQDHSTQPDGSAPVGNERGGPVRGQIMNTSQEGSSTPQNSNQNSPMGVSFGQPGSGLVDQVGSDRGQSGVAQSNGIVFQAKPGSTSGGTMGLPRAAGASATAIGLITTSRAAAVGAYVPADRPLLAIISSLVTFFTSILFL